MPTVPQEQSDDSDPTMVAMYHLNSDESIRELNGSMDLDTRFPIASVTKTLTALLAARLSVDGLVDWDEPLGARGRTTLRHLLNHTASVPFELVPSHWVTDSLTEAQLADALDDPPRLPFPPGTWHYSNLGYGMAALALERIMGASYDDLLATHVLRPIGLGRTSFPSESEGRRRLGAAGPAGDMWSTLSDLMTLAVALSGAQPEVVTPQMLAMMLESPSTDSSGALLGAGVKVHRLANHGVLICSGTISGHTTALTVWPRRGASVMVAEAGYSHDLLRDMAILRWSREDLVARTWWWDGQEVAEVRHGNEVELVVQGSPWPFPVFSGHSTGTSLVGVDWRGKPLELQHRVATLVGPGIVLAANLMDSAYSPGESS